MKSIYNTQGFSEELLLVCTSLREVGLDNLADQFFAAVFDRSVVDQAIIAHCVSRGEDPFAGACGPTTSPGCTASWQARAGKQALPAPPSLLRAGAPRCRA
ncbi:hypothetical protein N5K55_05435 [Pseudomonas aeruginosa]|nr:hypothetical protein [Pseudomonas aeruginosa]